MEYHSYTRNTITEMFPSMEETFKKYWNTYFKESLEQEPISNSINR